MATFIRYGENNIPERYFGQKANNNNNITTASNPPPPPPPGIADLTFRLQFTAMTPTVTPHTVATTSWLNSGNFRRSHDCLTIQRHK